MYAFRYTEYADEKAVYFDTLRNYTVDVKYAKSEKLEAYFTKIRMWRCCCG